jgi:hypothetical protein
VLLAIRDALAADGPISLDDLARRLDADPEVVRSVIAHARSRGWLDDVMVVADPVGCSAAGCRPHPSSSLCRRCPWAGARLGPTTHDVAHP